MQIANPIRTWLESSVNSALRNIISSNEFFFTLVNTPELAEIILFGKDEPNYIRRTVEFKEYPEKCIAINEDDQPSYFLPACYSSNRRSWLSYKRAQTIPYYITQRTTPNSFIEQFSQTNSRQYLYSFKGGSTSWVRKKLFKSINKHRDVCIEEANHYHHWNNEDSYLDQKEVLQRQYADLIGKSWFVLCPRGAGVSSIRLFEVMQAGRVPVIIADDWVPIAGIPWHEFSLQIPESRLRNIDSLIRSHESVAHDFGLKARQAWMSCCALGSDAEFLAQSIRTIQQNGSQKREQLIHTIFPILEAALVVKLEARRFLKYLILNAFVLTGRKFPYSLNRPIEERIREMKSK